MALYSPLALRLTSGMFARSRSWRLAVMNVAAPLLLDVKTAAHRLGVSRCTLDRWIARGDLRTAPIKGRRRISAAELERFADRAEARATESATS